MHRILRVVVTLCLHPLRVWPETADDIVVWSKYGRHATNIAAISVTFVPLTHCRE